MKYRHLLVAILITTTATFIWAEPSAEVVVQTPLSQVAAIDSDGQEKPSATEDWTYDISSPDKVEEPTPRPPVVSYTRANMGLDLAITPGKGLESTTFDVFVKLPEGSKLPLYNFSVVLEDYPNQVLFTNEVESLGNNRFRFRGTDLVDGNGARLPQIKSSTSCVVSTNVIDPAQSRYSRGAGFLTVKSQPVRLSLR